MSQHKIIIGLPVYNGQKYLEAAIDSHLAQSFSDFQIVISDNGSNDATEEICTRYARQDSRITYLRSPVNRASCGIIAVSWSLSMTRPCISDGRAPMM